MSDRITTLLAMGVLVLGASIIFSCTIDTKMQALVNKYCTTPVAERLALRNWIAQQIEPNSIVIHCAGDDDLSGQ